MNFKPILEIIKSVWTNPGRRKITLILLLIFTAGFFTLNAGYFFEPERKNEYALVRGDHGGFNRLLDQLSGGKMIRSRTFALYLARIGGFDKRAKAGVYTVTSRMSTLGILQLVAEGRADLVPVVVRPGADLWDIAAETESQGVLSAEKFLKYAQSDKARLLAARRFGLKDVQSIEGFIYPETYFVRKGEEPAAFINLAFDLFDERIGTFYRAKKRTESLEKLLVIASLIEKETAVESERPLVAGVIHNRIAKRDKLRIDPTIIYAIKKAGLVQQNLKRGQINIKREHFFLASPWNTYYTRKVPPTAICSPSISSFKAAVNPAKTDYYFFVAKGDGKGSHQFSVTYAEHERWVDLYQRNK